MGAVPCSRGGAHACRSAASHRGRWPWLRGVPYVAYVGDPPSPSGLPLRQAAVAGTVAALRGLAPGEMFAEADRRHAALLGRFRQREAEAMAALPAGARARAADTIRAAGQLDRAGLSDLANATYRRAYGLLGLDAEARSLEEVPAGYTCAIEERIRGGQLCGRRVPLFRLAESPEATSVAESGALRHHAGKDHLSFSLYMVEEYEGRPVLLVLGLTGNVVARLRALSYRSAAFSAPGSRPPFREVWDGTKSWRMARECEVRLRAGVPVRGLDLAVYLREFPGRWAWGALRGLCGARRVVVPESWPPDL